MWALCNIRAPTGSRKRFCWLPWKCSEGQAHSQCWESMVGLRADIGQKRSTGIQLTLLKCSLFFKLQTMLESCVNGNQSLKGRISRIGLFELLKLLIQGSAWCVLSQDLKPVEAPPLEVTHASVNPLRPDDHAYSVARYLPSAQQAKARFYAKTHRHLQTTH